MSEALEGIWFPIADNHHPNHPIIDQPTDIVSQDQSTHNTRQVRSKPEATDTVFHAKNHHPHNLITAQLTDGIQPPLTRKKRHLPTGVLQSNPITGPRLDLRPRQIWWMDTPNWSLTGFDPAGHVTW
jgi:hypothetical protein